MSFKKYINKLENQKSVVYAFGRFNPPTKGHQALWDFVSKQAKKIRGDGIIFTSLSQNARKNPLSFQDKIWGIKQGLPKGVSISNDTSLKNTFQIAEKLVKDGYTNIQFIVGADRIGDFDSLHKYVNQWSDGNAQIEIISFSGKSRIGNYSGTRMRELVKAGDFEGFFNDLPTGFSKKDALKFFNKVKEGLGIV